MNEYESLLTSAIKAVSDRFDSQCNRTFARTVDATEEFPAEDTELAAACYPIEAVTKFETKSTEAESWVEQTAPDYLIRRAGVIPSPRRCPSSPAPPASPLPSDIEQAAVEQVAFSFQKRDKLGLGTYWPSGAAYQMFRDQTSCSPSPPYSASTKE